MSATSSRSSGAGRQADRAEPQAASNGSETPVAASYEAAVSELEQLVADLEGGKLELEASLAAYQRGSALLRFCQAQLSNAEQQVRMLEDDTLVELDDDDEPA
ncbi:MAG: exodeoxyribonuclease VII small subunit [Pseudomonadota bacterium]|nr:exodeoxyribonuclease VII small subunit [Pseudomonadota bacterium]